jgi:NAD(P)-dependent dehydrogenase (short-subunit alcohol dehydrogenase family)
LNIIITGGTSGLGYRTAFILAKDNKNKIILIGKNKAKGNQAIKSLTNETNNKKISFLQADLSSISETSSLKEKLANNKIDVLINNAGALFYSRLESVDGIEKTFALNHLSYFILSNLLLKNKIIKNGARIINVASGAHRGVDINFDDIEMVNNYNGWISYKKSKLCNILFTKKLSKLVSKNNVTVNCLHPGFVKTNFGKNNTGVIGLIIKFLMTVFSIKVEEGAETIIYLATSDNVKNISGEYFYQSKINKPSNFAENNKSADDLWDFSLKILKNNNLTL